MPKSSYKSYKDYKYSRYLKYHKEPDYDKFKESLDVDAEKWDFKTKRELQTLMFNEDYRIRVTHHKPDKYGATRTLVKMYPTDRQVQFAWNYLKRRSKNSFIVKKDDWYKRETLTRRGRKYKVYRNRKGQLRWKM
jgi:hypothetical protein